MHFCFPKGIVADERAASPCVLRASARSLTAAAARCSLVVCSGSCGTRAQALLAAAAAAAAASESGHTLKLVSPWAGLCCGKLNRAAPRQDCIFIFSLSATHPVFFPLCPVACANGGRPLSLMSNHLVLLLLLPPKLFTREILFHVCSS